MIWRATDPQGNEAGKVKYDIVQYTRGAVLDLGCGPSKAFPHFVGVDSCVDTKLFGIQMKPDVEVDDCSDLSKFEDGMCDAVFSSHLLEHIEDPAKALREWWRVLRLGGYLVLYLPHRDLYPNIGQPGANPDHKHDFIPDDIGTMMVGVAHDSGTCYDCVQSEVRSQGTEYSFLMVFQKIPGDVNLYSFREPQPLKTACVVRYGGFGDMIQASNILPELQRQGYHVTFMTTPKGKDILREDPHVDAWFIQDENQVPNGELPYFWQEQAKRFDKFINLSESIEGTLLAIPGRANHAWPHAVRKVELNRNYLEWTSQLAELKHYSEAKFYPDSVEAARVMRYLAAVKTELAGELPIGAMTPPRFMIMWVLAGSSVHKFYPWMDSVLATIMMELPEAVVILTGDAACKLLEQGWENEPRIRCESGAMDIRSTLTMAVLVDCVVGPETGVMNAVAFENNDKVLMLSHSSKENLSKNWCHTTTLEPANTACFPCHRLHYGSTFCPQHEETGAALCQLDIAPERVFAAIRESYLKWKKP